MTYSVYAGGFYVLDANLDIDLENNKKYSITLSAHTRGFLKKMAPWEGIYETTGWQKNRGEILQPQIHRATSTWKGEKEVKEFSYNKDGSFKEYRVTDEYSKREKRKVPKELTNNTTDILSATMKVMQKLEKTGKCEGNSNIFDGKRKFTLIFKNKGSTVLKKSKHNIYSGPAVECSVEVKPLAGNWHKKPRGWMSIQEQGRKKGTMPTIWFAIPDTDTKNTTGRKTAIPVKVRVKTNYGTLFMHLTNYATDK